MSSNPFQADAAPAPSAHRCASALIVEDLDTVRDWLQSILLECFPGVAITLAGDLASARQRLATAAVDLVLVDLGLPDGSGIDLIREAHQRHPDMQMIVTTIYDDDSHLFPALRAGACGYLLKDQPREQLVRQLGGIARGEPPLSPAIARRMLRVFEPEQLAHDQLGRLSPREREALVLIAKGYRLAEVAEALTVTRNTAAGYVKSVYRKLEISSRAEAALAASRMGLVQPQL